MLTENHLKKTLLGNTLARYFPLPEIATTYDCCIRALLMVLHTDDMFVQSMSRKKYKAQPDWKRNWKNKIRNMLRRTGKIGTCAKTRTMMDRTSKVANQELYPLPYQTNCKRSALSSYWCRHNGGHGRQPHPKQRSHQDIPWAVEHQLIPVYSNCDNLKPIYASPIYNLYKIFRQSLIHLL